MERNSWCREINKENFEVSIKEWKPSDLFLDAVSIIKMSIEDIRTNYTHHEMLAFIKRIQVNKVILIITGGEHGSISFFPKNNSELMECYYTPVKIVTNVVDTTGAGDVWLITFTLQYHLTKNIYNSLAYASIVTSLKIQSEELGFKIIDQKELQKMIQTHEKNINLISLEQGLKKVFG